MSCADPQTAAEIATCGVQVSGNRAYGTTSPIAVPTLVGNLINALLGISGLILVGLLIYGGILYMTAQGDIERVKNAKKTMINAVIGIVIIVVAYAASTFIITTLINAQPTTTGIEGNPGQPCSIGGVQGTLDPSGACVQ